LAAAGRVFGQGKPELVEELLAPDYVSHAPGDPEPSRGPEAIKDIVRAYHSAFPDINFTVEKQVAEGGHDGYPLNRPRHPSGEFMGVAPSGRRIEVSGMSMDRISGGRIVENWNNWEALELMRQIGAIPDSERTRGA
jgi:predicted ester cyclase